VSEVIERACPFLWVIYSVSGIELILNMILYLLGIEIIVCKYYIHLMYMLTYLFPCLFISDNSELVIKRRTAIDNKAPTFNKTI